MIVLCTICSWFTLLQIMETSPLFTANSSHNYSKEPDFSQLHTEEPLGLSLWEEEPGDLQFMRQQNQDPDGLRFSDQLNIENVPEKRSSSTEIKEEIELESLDDRDDADITNHNETEINSTKVSRKKEHRKREASTQKIENSDTDASKGNPQPRVAKILIMLTAGTGVLTAGVLVTGGLLAAFKPQIFMSSDYLRPVLRMYEKIRGPNQYRLYLEDITQLRLRPSAVRELREEGCDSDESMEEYVKHWVRMKEDKRDTRRKSRLWWSENFEEDDQEEYEDDEYEEGEEEEGQEVEYSGEDLEYGYDSEEY